MKPLTGITTQGCSQLGPSLLPFPVEYMGHSKLINWLNAEIWQDAARQGTRRKSNQISFADPRFKPSWWPKDVWKWEETKSFSKVSEAFWSNYNLDNNFTTFMKFCVCQCLESHRILPEDHVNPHYNKEQLKGRMRHRGIITSPACSSSENSERTTSVNTSVQTDDVDNSQGPGEGSILSDTDSQVAGNNIDNSQGPGEATPSFLDQAEDNPAPL